MEALKAAIDGLEIISVDKTKLEKLVDKAQKYDLTQYTETTGKILTGACEEAQKVLGNKEATQEQIDNAYADLQKAIFGLRLIPDKGQLEGLIKNAQAVDIANCYHLYFQLFQPHPLLQQGFSVLLLMLFPLLLLLLLLHLHLDCSVTKQNHDSIFRLRNLEGEIPMIRLNVCEK